MYSTVAAKFVQYAHRKVHKGTMDGGATPTTPSPAGPHSPAVTPSPTGGAAAASGKALDGSTQDKLVTVLSLMQDRLNADAAQAKAGGRKRGATAPPVKSPAQQTRKPRRSTSGNFSPAWTDCGDICPWDKMDTLQRLVPGVREWRLDELLIRDPEEWKLDACIWWGSSRGPYDRLFSSNKEAHFGLMAEKHQERGEPLRQTSFDECVATVVGQLGEEVAMEFGYGIDGVPAAECVLLSLDNSGPKQVLVVGSKRLELTPAPSGQPWHLHATVDGQEALLDIPSGTVHRLAQSPEVLEAKAEMERLAEEREMAEQAERERQEQAERERQECEQLAAEAARRARAQAHAVAQDACVRSIVPMHHPHSPAGVPPHSQPAGLGGGQHTRSGNINIRAVHNAFGAPGLAAWSAPGCGPFAAPPQARQPPVKEPSTLVPSAAGPSPLAGPSPFAHRGRRGHHCSRNHHKHLWQFDRTCRQPKLHKELCQRQQRRCTQLLLVHFTLQHGHRPTRQHHKHHSMPKSPALTHQVPLLRRMVILLLLSVPIHCLLQCHRQPQHQPQQPQQHTQHLNHLREDQ